MSDPFAIDTLSDSDADLDKELDDAEFEEEVDDLYDELHSSDDEKRKKPDDFADLDNDDDDVDEKRRAALKAKTSEAGKPAVLPDLAEGEGSDKEGTGVVEVSGENAPARGDMEEMVDGKLVMTKGAGVKNRKQIALNVMADPRFEKSLSKVKEKHANIIKNLVRTYARVEDLDFADLLQEGETGKTQSTLNCSMDINKSLKEHIKDRVPNKGDRWEPCRLGTANEMGGKYVGDEELDEEYMAQGYHPECSCDQCRRMEQNDDLARAKANRRLKRKADAERRAAEHEEKKERKKRRQEHKKLKTATQSNDF
jgi:hypothetical protein